MALNLNDHLLQPPNSPFATALGHLLANVIQGSLSSYASFLFGIRIDSRLNVNARGSSITLVFRSSFCDIG